MRRIMPTDWVGRAAVSPPKVCPGGDGEQVGAQPVELGEQVRLAGLGDAQHRHDRGDADGHAQRGQRRT
jgi:hypothetical protein